MRSFLKSIIHSVAPSVVLARRERYRLREFSENYLRPKGWFGSALSRQSTDNNGPVPWITYAAREIIERNLRADMRVFEYGCGNSSLWWATKVAEVVSVEHATRWADEVRKAAPANLTIISRPENDGDLDHSLLQEFLASSPELPSLGSHMLDVHHGMLTKEFASYALELTRRPKSYFDIVVVDGMARSFCAWIAARYVHPKGLVVFDNSGRWQYNAGYLALANLGFKRVDFYGPMPVGAYESCTSIFCRDLDWVTNVKIPRTQRADPDWPQGD